MKATHTPGPWHVGMKPGPIIYGTKGEEVADCRHSDDPCGNSRIIAAAPDLLAALKVTHAWAHKFFGADWWRWEQSEAGKACISAIAKATGKGVE